MRFILKNLFKIYHRSSENLGIDTCRCSSGPVWCRHNQVQYRTLQCRRVQEKLRSQVVDRSEGSTGLSSVNKSRSSTGYCCPVTSRCSSGPCVDIFRSSTDLSSVDTSICNSDSFNRFLLNLNMSSTYCCSDTSRCSLDTCSVVQTTRGAALAL